MKEFVKTVKQTFQVSWQELAAYNVIALCGGVFGIIVALILMGTGAMEGEYATIGAMIGVVIGMMLMLVIGIFSLQQDFNLAISLGKTRKHYIPARFLFHVANCLLCIITVLIIGGIENILYTAIYPGAVCVFSVDSFLVRPVVLLAIVLLIPAMILFIGAFYIKFGPKFAGVFWVLWMLGCMGPSRMIKAVKHTPESFLGRAGAVMIDFLTQLTAVQVNLGIVGISIVGIIATFMILRKQSVTA